MKKPKVNLSGDAIKSFFTYHVEKLILVGVLVMVGLFVMWGYQMEGFTAYTPDRMKSDSEAARSNMTRDDVWNDIEEEPERDVEDTKETMKKGIGDEKDGKLPEIGPIAKVYESLQPQNPPMFAPNAKRSDPEIYAATEVEVEAGFGPLAMPNPQGAANPNDPLAGLDPLMRAAQAYQMKLREDAMSAAATPSRNGRRDPNDLLEGGPGPGPGREGGALFGASSGRDSSSIPLTPEQQESLVGFRGQGTEMPRGLNFVAVTALAPYKKQWDEYEAVLKDSSGYDLGRDTPTYVWFVVERAEVAPDGQQSAWVPISNSGKARQLEQQYYAGTAPDIVDPRYTDPALTMSVPPILLRDLSNMAVHSKTPLISLEDESAVDDPNAAPANPAEFGANDDGPGVPTLQPGDFSNSGGRTSPYGAESGRTPPYGGSNQNFGEGGERGRGAPGDGSLPTEEIVDYKLVRFFDFSVVPGKKYVYRVQLWVTDPNHPQDPTQAPPPALLQEEVNVRVKALDLAQSKSPNAPRVFYRMTEWSQPSKPVGVPKSWAMLAGEMPETKMVRIRISNDQEASFEMPGEEPTAHMMTIKWDPKYAADIPGEADVYRGSMLNFTTNVNVLHPPSATVVTLPDYKFDTNAMVVDLRGGEALPGSDRKNPLMVPTEMLIIDRDGNMIVRNELDDKRDFRLNDYEKPPEVEVPRNDPNMELDRNFDPLLGGEGGERGRQPRRGRN